LAMMCDIMVCGDKAKFGQPEINLGVIPGCGGTQRLIKAVGKSKAMEMCLAGTMIGAEEAKVRNRVASEEGKGRKNKRVGRAWWGGLRRTGLVITRVHRGPPEHTTHTHNTHTHNTHTQHTHTLHISTNTLSLGQASGLVAQVYPAADLVEEAVKMADNIASKSQLATMVVKETVNASYELSLAEGLRFERRMFHALFASEDQKEGMTAFVEKRKAEWKHR